MLIPGSEYTFRVDERLSEKVIVIPPFEMENEENQETSYSEASDSDVENRHGMTPKGVQIAFSKKYYEKCKDDSRVRSVEKDGKTWYKCVSCTKSDKNAVNVLDHHVVHHESKKFLCPHDNCDSEIGSVRQLIDHLKTEVAKKIEFEFCF